MMRINATSPPELMRCHEDQSCWENIQDSMYQENKVITSNDRSRIS